MACVNREMGFVDSGFNLPRMKISISTGTRVIARTDENPIARVLVQARGRNILPSCASSRNTGRNETTMMMSEKKMGGPTCLAAPIRSLRRSARLMTDEAPPRICASPAFLVSSPGES